MNRHSTLSSHGRLAIASGALVALLVMHAPALEARERGAAPQRPARVTETQRIDGGYVRSTTLTRPDGATASRQRVVVRDREAGTRSVDVTQTGFDGRTRTMSQVMQRTDDGWTSSRTWTNANGQSFERAATVRCDSAARQCTKTVTSGRVDGD